MLEIRPVETASTIPHTPFFPIISQLRELIGKTHSFLFVCFCKDFYSFLKIFLVNLLSQEQARQITGCPAAAPSCIFLCNNDFIETKFCLQCWCFVAWIQWLWFIKYSSLLSSSVFWVVTWFPRILSTLNSKGQCLSLFWLQ